MVAPMIQKSTMFGQVSKLTLSSTNSEGGRLLSGFMLHTVNSDEAEMRLLGDERRLGSLELTPNVGYSCLEHDE